MAMRPVEIVVLPTVTTETVKAAGSRMLERQWERQNDMVKLRASLSSCPASQVRLLDLQGRRVNNRSYRSIEHRYSIAGKYLATWE